MSEEYYVDMVCTNCGKEVTQVFKKGTKVGKKPCSYCGCRTCEPKWSRVSPPLPFPPIAPRPAEPFPPHDPYPPTPHPYDPRWPWRRPWIHWGFDQPYGGEERWGRWE